MAKKQANRLPSPAEMRSRLDKAITEGRFQTALDLAKQINKIEPSAESKNRLILCYLGRANQLREQGSVRDAKTVLEAVQGLINGDATLQMRFAEESARNGEIATALQCYHGIPEPRPTNSVLALVADAAIQRGNAVRPQLPEALHGDFDRVRSAFAQLAESRDDLVRESLQSIGLNSPFLEWKVLIRGFLAYYQSDNARALENWSRLDPRRLPARLAAPYRIQIDLPFADSQSPSMRQQLQRQADQLVQDGVVVALRKIQLAMARSGGNIGQAIRDLEKILPKLKEHSPEQFNRLARCFYWQVVEDGHPDDLNFYVRAFGVPKDDPAFSRMAALASEREGSFDMAHGHWQRYEKNLDAISNFSDAERARARAMIWFRMGRNAFRQSELASGADRLPPGMLPFDDGFSQPLRPTAEECMRRSIAFASDWIDPYVGLVDVVRRDDSTNKVLEVAETLLSRFPEHQATLTLLAGVYQQLGKLQETCATMERAVAADPLNRSLRITLGQARRRLGTQFAIDGRFDDARQAFRASLELMQQGAHPWLRSAWAACEIKAGDHARAEELLKETTSTLRDQIVANGNLYVLAGPMKLAKAVKTHFEREFKACLDAPNPSPEQAEALLNFFAVLQEERVSYHGSKSHQKKAIQQVQRSLKMPWPESLIRNAGHSLLRLQEHKQLAQFALLLSLLHPANAWVAYFQLESTLVPNKARWPLFRLEQLVQRAKQLAEKMPPGSERDELLQAIERRAQEIRELNPFADLYDRFMEQFDDFDEDEYSEDEPW